MKKRIITIISILVLIAVCFVSCGETVSLIGTSINENGELVLKMSDGTEKNMGVVKGEKGEKGEKGDAGAQGAQGVPGPAAGNDNPQGLEFYPLPDGTYAVSLGNAVLLDEVVIPSSYDGKTITQIIASYDRDGDAIDIELKKVTLPDTITTIGHSAFKSCGKLTSITIPNSVKSIDEDAFLYCYNLVEIINKSSIDITVGSRKNGWVAFYAKEVHTGDSKVAEIDGYWFYPHSNGTNHLFMYTGEKTDIILPSSFNNEDYIIDSTAFKGNKNLTSIIIPDCVTEICDEAFMGCDAITKLVIGNGVTTIGKRLFVYDVEPSQLISVTLGSNVTTIADDAFRGTSKLVEVINKSSLPIVANNNNYGYIAANAFEVHSGESKIVKKGDYHFYTHSNGTNYLVNYSGTDEIIYLPENFNNQKYVISNYTFYGNDYITKAYISGGVSSIGENIFSSCDNIVSISIAEGISEIGDNAFGNCNELESVVIPISVNTIGKRILGYNTDTVYYRGTEAQWNEINIDSAWYSYNAPTIIYSSTGE